MIEDNIEEKINLIKEYISEKECRDMHAEKVFDCEACRNYEDCCIEAEIRCNDDFNDIFAKSVDYGGYGNEEDFWEQLLD